MRRTDVARMLKNHHSVQKVRVELRGCIRRDIYPVPRQILIVALIRLVQMFRSQMLSFSDPAVHQLLRENYPEEVVAGYLANVGSLGLDTTMGRYRWFLRKLLSLPSRLSTTRQQWRRLADPRGELP